MYGRYDNVNTNRSVLAKSGKGLVTGTPYFQLPPYTFDAFVFIDFALPHLIPHFVSCFNSTRSPPSFSAGGAYCHYS